MIQNVADGGRHRGFSQMGEFTNNELTNMVLYVVISGPIGVCGITLDEVHG
jgi:hypothetical protein